ncbi:unnamed protein product [Cylicostephanus goldi]|uniref:Exostosin GT47 domain-containing protein n=1 Tax=Cylicostephanus goldi TaxID=71465 RepID=A0A3P6SLV3_CYLGO|nr:unnamed protein product [Cylicostephanus goldi]
MGCIPVVLSDDWVLPFDEVIDWSAAAVVVPEDSVLLVPDLLYTFTAEKIYQMKQRGFFIYQRYFSSVEKIAITALEIVWERMRIAEAKERTQWNHLHPIDATKSAHGVNVVVRASEKPSSRLQKVVLNVAKIESLRKIVILWPNSRGVPPVGADFGTKSALEFVLINNRSIDFASLQRVCDNGFVLFVDERLNPPFSEMSALIDYVERNPNRLIGVHGIEFDVSSFFSVMFLNFYLLGSIPFVVIFQSCIYSI